MYSKNTFVICNKKHTVLTAHIGGSRRRRNMPPPPLIFIYLFRFVSECFKTSFRLHEKAPKPYTLSLRGPVSWSWLRPQGTSGLLCELRAHKHLPPPPPPQQKIKKKLLPKCEVFFVSCQMKSATLIKIAMQVVSYDTAYQDNFFLVLE